jgi:hypothetical protein
LKISKVIGNLGLVMKRLRHGILGVKKQTVAINGPKKTPEDYSGVFDVADKSAISC